MAVSDEVARSGRAPLGAGFAELARNAIELPAARAGVFAASGLIAIAGLTGCAGTAGGGAAASQLSPAHPGPTVIEMAAYTQLRPIPDWLPHWTRKAPRALRVAADPRRAPHHASAAHSTAPAIVAHADPAPATGAAHADPQAGSSWSTSTHTLKREVIASNGSSTTTVTTTKTTTVNGKTTQSTHVVTTVIPPRGGSSSGGAHSGTSSTHGRR